MDNKTHRRVINPNFTNEEWYSNEYILSNFPKYKIFVTAGSRGRGKTYSGKNLILNRFNKRHKKKFAWIRLNDEPIQNMLSNNGSSFFEPSLLRKKHIGVKTETGNIYFTKDIGKDKDKQS